MPRSDEKLCLQWNEFRDNASSSFRDLRDDKDFTDVTLACEDGQQVEAHKVVLISSSPFFLNMLKKNKHSHPLVYMRGLKYENLLSLVDFLYLGEANVHQDNLDSFLAIAEELRLKGLDKREEEVEPTPSKREISFKKNIEHFATPEDKRSSLGPQNAVAKGAITNETNFSLSYSSGEINLEELDQRVKSMMASGENKIDRKYRKSKICTICGKEGQQTAIVNHIEANHMTNISIPCNVCGKKHSTRAALFQHKQKHHSQSAFLGLL